ncbi:MAG: cache domain-containing protein [Lachnospiraceae bacterium]|nr:cache domain-containing protein [Lachnospiraceae bacterium]
MGKEKNKKIKNTTKKKIRIWSFSRRLLALCILPMIITCILVTWISTSTLKSAVETEIENSMKIIAASISETYTNLYEGDYTMDQGGKIRKGETVISGETQLVDAMKEKTEFDVTMMFGNMRLLTTVIGGTGRRATGTPTDAEVYKRIEAGETVFLKDFEVGQNICYAYYEPLINSDGSVFGAIEVAKEGSSIEATIKKQTAQLTMFSVFIVALVGVLVALMSRGTVGKMQRIKVFLDHIIEGKLDHQPDVKSMKSNDELGDVYRSGVKLQDSFHDMVSGIKVSSDNLRVSASRLSGMAQNTAEAAGDVQLAVEQISDGARSQADSTVEARSSVGMINSQIEQIIGEVDIMAENAVEMSRKEKESEAIIRELSESSDDTKNSVSRATQQISLMSSAINDIKSAIQLIQSIADETDLLALNANIEAARAGEAGRGFSVVADQISKLAIQSNTSSQDIQRVIEKILEISDKAVAVMEEVRINMDIQQQKLNLTRETYQAVADGVEQSLRNMENIKQKITILDSSGASISNAIDDLSYVSEQNADSASNTIQTVKDMNDTMQLVQNSSEELLLMAEELQRAMGSFIV